MGWFITAILLLVAGIVAFIIRSKVQVTDDDSAYQEETKREIRIGLAIGGPILLFLGVLTIFLNSYSIVPPRNIGIPVAFGSPRDSVDNGWTWTKPWETVELVDGTTQTITRDVDLQNAVHVRLGNQTTGDVDLVIQWSIDPVNARNVWQKYRGKDPDALIATVQGKVIEPLLDGAVREALKSHDPLGDAIAGRDSALSYPDMAKEVEAILRPNLDKGIVLDKVAIRFIHYDAVTQEKLNTYAQALADTKIAAQRVATAEQVRLANEKLAQNKSTENPGVQFQNCLTLIQELATKGQLQNLPPTFNCGGASIPVIVGQK